MKTPHHVANPRSKRKLNGQSQPAFIGH